MSEVSDSHKKALCGLIYRPNEPVFVPKKDIPTLEIPTSAYPVEYQYMSQDIYSRFSEDDGNANRVNVKEIKWPDLEFCKSIRKEDAFNTFFEPHIEIAGKLIELFYGMESAEDLLACAVYVRDRVNPYLFVYSFSVALAHRKDTKNIVLPDCMLSFPGKFLPKTILSEVKEIGYVVPGSLRKPIVIPRNFTATDRDPEHRCAFFREDIGINLHHWHWHLAYPFAGPPDVVNKDRRGELFYYMHNQLLNRFNANRICVGLGRVMPFDNFIDGEIPPYYPKLNNHNSSRMIIGRPRGYKWQTINGITSPPVTCQDMLMILERINIAITLGYAILPNGEKFPLTIEEGIDTLGNMVESSQRSPNTAFYGSFHNTGHMFCALSADPSSSKYLESPGVMADTATAVRDPIFFRWHKCIDDVFTNYKYTLPPYTAEELACPGIKIDKVNLIVNQKYVDELTTFWQWDDIDLAIGMDFARTSTDPLYIRFCHLNYEDFVYKINVTNSTTAPIECTVRLFMFPALNESGTPYTVDMFRRNAIEMDCTMATFPPGETKWFRSSKDNNVTVAFDRTFSTAYQNDPTQISSMENSFCACGLPSYLLLPIGTPEGFPFNLVVVITPWSLDKANDDINVPCNDNSIFCGLRDRKYPFKRPMGFPFDRVLINRTIDEFLDKDNMYKMDFKIKHKNIAIKGPHCGPDPIDY
ncbi:hypothetical protein DMENIID0001_039680 [Sergentomyia squamirostris]